MYYRLHRHHRRVYRVCRRYHHQDHWRSPWMQYFIGEIFLLLSWNIFSSPQTVPISVPSQISLSTGHHQEDDWEQEEEQQQPDGMMRWEHQYSALSAVHKVCKLSQTWRSSWRTVRCKTEVVKYPFRSRSCSCSIFSWSSSVSFIIFINVTPSPSQITQRRED